MKKRNARLISILTSVFLVFPNVAARKGHAATNEKLALSSYLSMYNEELLEEKVRKVYMEDFKQKKIKVNDKKDQQYEKEVSLNPEEKVRIIVQLNEKSVSDVVKSKEELSVKANDINLKNSLLSKQEPLKEAILKINPEASFKNNFYVLNNGFSLEAKAKDIEAIREMPGVKRVSIANEYFLDMNNAVKITKADEVWKNKGYKGEGLVVAIVDTGIDVNHKDMKLTDSSKAKLKKEDIKSGKGLYFTEKVPYGYNFADDNKDVKDQTSSMHGMHVAGIVAANADDSEIQAGNGVKGVAPEAQLLAMKVFTNDPNFASAFSDNIAAAIDDSVAHGADVINMSLGGSAGFVDAEDIEQLAVKKASNAGVVCTISAGNSTYSTSPVKYPELVDTGLVGSPATSEESLMVASYENTITVAPHFGYKAKGAEGHMYYYVSSDEINPVGVLNFPNGYEVVDCGLGTESDFEGKNLNGKVALIKRGGLTFIDKKKNAQKAGAEAAIIFNHKPGQIGGMANDKSIKIPTMGMSGEDGQKLLTLVTSGLKLTFKGEVYSDPNVNMKDMSDFTSWGPTPNLLLRPLISAPGGQILSTVNNNKYENMSGTSMAAPHTAGLTALVLQHMQKTEEFKNITGREKVEIAKKLLINTAEPNLDKLTNSELPFSPRRQGAGLANVDSAVKNFVTATFTENGEAVASLKEVRPNSSKTFSIKLKNYGDKAVTYSVIDLYGVLTEQTNPADPEKVPMSYDINFNEAKLSYAESVTVQAKGEKEVSFTLKVDKNAKKDIFLEGFIRFESEDENVPSIGMPYLAFYGDWDKLKMIDEPEWNEETIWRQTKLLTMIGDGLYPLGVEGVDENGNTIYNPNFIAINPQNKEELNNVLPMISLLRNAKKLEIEVTDDKGNSVRKISEDRNVRKAYSAKNRAILANWLWDGTIYNAAVGKYEPALDGQYAIKISATADFEGAEPQSISLPVKIDSNKPVVSDIAYRELSTGVYNIRFKAEDTASGINSFAMIVDSPDNLHSFDGKKFIKLSPDENGYYNVVADLGNNNHVIGMVAIDNAGNFGLNVESITNLTITSPARGSAISVGDIDISFQLKEELLDKISHYEIIMSNDGGKSIETIGTVEKLKNSFRVRSLDPGEYIFAVNAVPLNSENGIGYLDVIKVKVKSTKVAIDIISPKPAQMFNLNDTIKAEGTLEVKPSLFKINGQNVLSKIKPTTIKIKDAEGKETGQTREGYSFSVELKKEELKRGINKVKFELEYKDAFGKQLEKYNYSVDMFYEDKMPGLQITTPSTTIGSIVVDYVDNKASSYTIKGQSFNYMNGYKLYCNGEAILNVEQEGLIDENNNKTRRDFEKEVQLISKFTKSEIKVISATGLQVAKEVSIRKMDYPEAGVDFQKLKDGLVVNYPTFNVEGHYNYNFKNMEIKANGKVLNLKKDNDIFGGSVTLKPGENIIKIEVKSEGKEPFVKEFKVIYEKDDNMPTLNIEGGQSEDGKEYLFEIPTTQRFLELKGTAGDKKYGYTVQLIQFEYDNGRLTPIDSKIIVDSKEASENNFKVDLPVEGMYAIYGLRIQNEKHKSADKLIVITKTDKFFEDFGIVFNKPIYDYMIVNTNTPRFDGVLTKELEIFRIDGINVKRLPDRTFDVVIPLSEGINKVNIEAAVTTSSAITTPSSIMVEVICDTVAPTINVDSVENEEIYVSADTEKITLSGNIEEAGIPRLSINGKEVSLKDNKYFNEEIKLEEGENYIKFLAKDLAGNLSEKNLTIYRTAMNNAGLQGIKIDGKELLSFMPNKYEYNYTIDPIEFKIPEVEALLSATSKCKVNIIKAEKVPGTTIIEVIAADGVTKLTYKINFVREIDVKLLQPTTGIIEKGKNIEVAFNAKNNLNAQKEITLVAALYDGTRFITWTSVTSKINASGNSAIKVNFDVPGIGINYNVKCFALDPNNNMRLLSDQIVIK